MPPSVQQNASTSTAATGQQGRVVSRSVQALVAGDDESDFPMLRSMKNCASSSIN
jgi:hypothetical protein